MRASWYRERVWRGAAPRLGVRSPPDRPPRAACSGAGHRRVSLPARRLISGAPAAPGSPRAVRSSLAARWLQLQARGARSERPEPAHPRAPCRGRAAPPLPAPPAQRPAAVGRAFALSIAPAARAALSGAAAAAAQVRDQLSLASSAPLGPAARPRLLTLPPSPPAAPAPARRPRLCGAPRSSTHTPTRSLRPSPGTHADPRERREGWPGAQGMNISVLAKLPSADVMAPAAVVTGRIPQRAKEEARGSGPRCWWSGTPQGHPPSGEGHAEGWWPGQPPVRSAPRADQGNAPGRTGPASRSSA